MPARKKVAAHGQTANAAKPGNDNRARDRQIVEQFVAGQDEKALAKKFKIKAGEVTDIVRSFADSVLKPVYGEFAVANPDRWVSAKLPQYNPSVLVTRKGMAVFDMMRNDDQIKAAMMFKKLAAISSGWEIVSPENEDEKTDEVNFAKDQFDKIEDSFGHVLLNILLACDFGFSLGEKIWQPIEEGDWAGNVGLKAIKSKKPHHISFKMDEFGNLERDGVIQHSAQYGAKSLPTSKFVIFSYQKEWDNVYGKSDLEAAYPRWWIKENAYRWLSVLLERFGIPPIFALYDPASMNPEQVRMLRQVIERIQAATAGAIPRASREALELWTPELAGNTERVFIPALEMLNRDLARALLMPGLLGLSPDSAAGSFARARVEFDVFILMIEFLRKLLAEVVNKQVIKPLIDFNYAVEKYPVFRFMPLTDDLRLDMFRLWKDFVGGKVVKPQAEDEIHIRKAFGMPSPSSPRDDSDYAPEPAPPPGGGPEQPPEQPPEEDDPLQEDEALGVKLPYGDEYWSRDYQIHLSWELADIDISEDDEDGDEGEAEGEDEADALAEFYEPDQPRDDDGQWTAGGGGGRGGDKPKGKWEADDGFITAYHGTVKSALSDIKDEGITVNNKRSFEDGSLYEGTRGESVFVANSEETALWYARIRVANLRRGTPVVLTVKIPKKEFENHYLNDAEHIGTGAALSTRKIKSAWIVEARTWGESRGFKNVKFSEGNGDVERFLVLLVEDEASVVSHTRRFAATYEKKVNFKAIERNLDQLEARARELLIPSLVNVRDRFLEHVKRKFDYDPNYVRDLKELRGLPTVGNALTVFLTEAFDYGAATVKVELPKAYAQGHIKEFAEPNYKPKDAAKWLRAKTFYITGVMDSRIRDKARGILLNAITTGEPIDRVIAKLEDEFEPYVGKPGKLRGGEVINPDRLETIIRTNATDAFNKGRIVEARRAGPFLVAFEYSIILDAATTHVCEFLDGKLFRPEDPALDSLTPPRWFNCRSILVPVSIDEEVDEEDFITPAEVQKGIELSHVDFGGQSTRSYLEEKGQRPFEFYDPDQPRVPAGSPDGGQFGPGGGGGSSDAASDAAFEKLLKVGDKLNDLERDIKNTKLRLKRALKNDLKNVAASAKSKLKDLAAKKKELSNESDNLIGRHFEKDPNRDKDPSRDKLVKSPTVKAFMRQAGLTGERIDDAASDMAHIFKRDGVGKLSDSEVIAISAYKGDGAARINSALRKGAGGKVREFTQRLNSAIEKHGDFQGTVYRGIAVSDAVVDKLARVYRPGRVVKENAFLSTSKTLRATRDFGDVVIFKIRTKKGLDYTKLLRDGDFDEKEVLLGAGSRFKVTSVSRGRAAGGNVLDVNMEHIR